MVYVSGYNIFTWRKSEFDYIDPEISKTYGRFGQEHPQMGSYNLGLQINF